MRPNGSAFGRGLPKICEKPDIPTPPLGYWPKLAQGKRVKWPPLPATKKGVQDQSTWKKGAPAAQAASRAAIDSPATRNLVLEFFFAGTGALLGCTALQEMPRFAGFASRTLGRMTTDLGLQFDDVDELVGLAAQLIGDHRRLRRGGGDHTDAHPAALHRFDQRAEIPVAGEQHHVIDVTGKFHGIDGELDIHVAFDLAAAGLVDELFGRFSYDRVTVVVEPVDQWPNRGKFLILDNGG